MNPPLTTPTLSQRAWQQYRCNLPRHLIGLSRYLQSRLMHELTAEHGHTDLALHFEPYISLAGDEGIGLSQLAETLSISKQAVNQAVNQIEKAGYLRRESDPQDGRARRAVLTERGRRLRRDGAARLAAIEADFRAVVGEANLSRFTDGLAELYGSPGSPVTRRNNGDAALGWLLPRISDSVKRELMELTKSSGHPGLKMSYAQVLTLMTPAGGRIQEMARINDVSKQAISAIARELQELGYLRRIADPADARQVILCFTQRGVRLMEDSIASTETLGARFAARIGAGALAELKQTAESLYTELGLENEVFDGSARNIASLAEEILGSLGIQRARLLAQQLMNVTEYSQ